MGEILNNVRAQVLVDALPYIQKYNNKILVVKYGGNAMTNKELKQAVMDDIVLLSLVGVKVVLVHGGGPEISDMLKRLNIESKFIGGLRYTDEAAVDVVKMVLSGKVNKELVSLLTRTRGKALGMCGIDGHMLTAERKLGPNGEDLGFVGDIVKVNEQPILDALNNGYIPVIATVATDEFGQSYNVNADTAAARIAAQLRAENLILMTDIAGLLRDKDDPSTLIPFVNVSEVPFLKRKGIISGGMIPTYLNMKSLHLTGSLWGLILPFMISVYNLIILKTSFASIPESLIEAARIDGASHLKVLFSIVLPLSKAILAVMVLYYGVGVWNGWFWASAILRDREMYPLQLVLREILLQNSTSNMTGGTSVGDVESVAATVKYATIMVATVPILCIYPFLQKYFAAGVMVGAVKE